MSAATNPVAEALTLQARDGHGLAADFFAPAGPTRGAVLIAGAMGVPRRFYAAFASDLAAHGLAVLTLDYRGFGGSAPQRLRGYRAQISDWIDQDLPAAVAALTERAPGAPLFWLGHSVGGQLFGFMDSSRFAGALLIASQSGHWALWDKPHWRRRMWMLGHVMLPGFAALLGRFPGKLLGGDDLPAGVARQWGGWIRDPEYLGRLARSRQWADFARYRGPLRVVTISDDDYAPPRTGEALLRYFQQAQGERITVTPAGIGAERIGHFDGFRAKFRDSLWPQWRGWLLAQTG
ncbi:MAG: alpha/beta fold hydrolase [Stagnimonas sp.]|nr:alpha/beta fold hydrolase [Stagnimonas sp.]